MSLGETLRNARKEKGMSLDDVARATYIRAQFIEAIERDDFSTIPPSRTKYFVQDIARQVGLDPVEITNMLPDQTARPTTPQKPQPEQSEREERISFGRDRKKDDSDKESGEGREDTDPKLRSVFVAPTSDLPTSGSERADPRRRPRYGPIEQGNPSLVRGLMTAAIVLLVGLGIYYMIGGFDDDSADGEEVAAVADSGDAGSEVRIISRPDDTASVEPGDVVAGDSLVLEGRATARVWYSIRMDSRQETGTLDSGDVKVWKAEKQFSVSLGNAGGLDFSLNGESLGALGAKGTTFRGKVITAEGVKVTSAPRRRATQSRRSQSDDSEDDPASRLRRLEDSEPRPAVDPE